MPRKPKASPAPTPPPTAPTQLPPGPMPLSPSAQQLHDEVTRQWSLTPVVSMLLDLACMAITRAEACDEITGREGLVILDSKGTQRPHPMALLSRDLRNQAAHTLQKITSNLD
jgi:hypothetical protein